MRQKNEKFANNVRAGKTAVQPSTRDKLKKKSPIGYTALVIIIFVLVGGGLCLVPNLIACVLILPRHPAAGQYIPIMTLWSRSGRLCILSRSLYIRVDILHTKLEVPIRVRMSVKYGMVHMG